MKRILLIEDDTLLGQGLRDYLHDHGYACEWVTQSQQVEKHWFSTDLVILDRQLHDGDSLKHLPHWLMLKALPVIVLTAKIEVEQRIEGLKAGAKDYVLKPFSTKSCWHASKRNCARSAVAYSATRILWSMWLIDLCCITKRRLSSNRKSFNCC